MPAELGAILWEGERAADPALPRPCAVHVHGVSGATQVSGAGPLRQVVAGAVLATNAHGLAPFFTASLEAAVQAGALAATAVDPGRVARLPMGAPRALPWARGGAGPRAAQRRFELASPPLSCTAAAAWRVFVDLPAWPCSCAA